MLYAGAVLMIGASIYGFVDYRKTRQKKEFKEMYTEKKTVTPADVVLPDVPVMPEKKKEPAAVKHSEKPKPGVGKGKQSEAVQPVAEEPAPESKVLKTVKKKRKLKRELFSRAPLRDEDEYLEEPVVKEEKKTDKKEL